MKYPLYSVRDALVGFDFPRVDQSDATASRGFSYSINSSDGIQGFRPMDYDLYKVGEFDTEKGELIPCLPVLVCSGASVFNEK